MSISQTASALYIQRSGLAKRLNTIHKLIPEDWAQLDTRLHDRLYFAMLRRWLVEKPFRQPEQFTLNYLKEKNLMTSYEAETENLATLVHEMLHMASSKYDKESGIMNTRI